jgi:hypothetical protein
MILSLRVRTGNIKGGKYDYTVDLQFDWFGISCIDNFCLYLQNRLIQTSQTGDKWYSDTPAFSIPCFEYSRSWHRLKMAGNFLV